MYWLLMFWGVVLLLVVIFSNKSHSIDDYFPSNDKTKTASTAPRQAIQLSQISNGLGWSSIASLFHQVKRQLGSFAGVKVVLLSGCVSVLAGAVNRYLFGFPAWLVLGSALVVTWVWGFLWLKQRDRKQFEESFPDALNMLASSLSAGESIGRGIGFVGNKLPGEVGKEFKRMAERLKLGEPLDDVFRKSCQRFPYPSFHFFVITLRANMQRGGQLKEVMSRLNRQMFEARAMERKKFAMTSEARISAKIVSATPFVFISMLPILSPENFDFLMFTDEGRPVLYYLLISESIGLAIIWMLMKRVR
ncbi:MULTISPECIES: type II secretion system F family protein [Vibrio]|nr:MULTISPECIES: type II secretion system F family protein [Vibrio]MDH5951360.1 type II secretion system F family protein [Vibrio crassostreae]MDL5027885.1 type II secretion system F family protein [Vibrio sp. TMPB1044]MDN5208013.1 type II secretion system F family protein [Vibrio sp. TMPB1044]